MKPAQEVEMAQWMRDNGTAWGKTYKISDDPMEHPVFVTWGDDGKLRTHSLREFSDMLVTHERTSKMGKKSRLELSRTCMVVFDDPPAQWGAYMAALEELQRVRGRMQEIARLTDAQRASNQLLDLAEDVEQFLLSPSPATPARTSPATPGKSHQ